MVMLAEHYDFVIGGDPDRDTIDLAVLDAATGRVRAHLADRPTVPAIAGCSAWAERARAGRRVWALEGTGSFAAGLVAVLAEAGEDVVEIRAPSGPAAPRTTGSTPIRAARTALSRDASGAPRVPVACGRRCAWCSPAGKGFWSAAPRPSTNSRA